MYKDPAQIDTRVVHIKYPKEMKLVTVSFRSWIERTIMPIDFYHVPGSAPCRATRLVAAEVGVELNLKLIDLMAGEQLTPEFLKMNPSHTVPTIDDNGYYLGESRAIMCYLANHYGKNDHLYPKCPRKRAIVDEKLHWDLGTLYQAFIDYYYPQIFAGAPRDEDKYKKIQASFQVLNKILEGKDYVAGDDKTIADISILTTVSNYQLLKFDLSEYKNVLKWFSRIKKQIPNYDDINGEGLKAFKGLIESLNNVKI